jgi:hypothetical protein
VFGVTPLHASCAFAAPQRQTILSLKMLAAEMRLCSDTENPFSKPIGCTSRPPSYLNVGEKGGQNKNEPDFERTQHMLFAKCGKALGKVNADISALTYENERLKA